MHVWISRDAFDLPAVSSVRRAGQMPMMAWVTLLLDDVEQQHSYQKRRTKEKPTRSDACRTDKSRNKNSRGSYFVPPKICPILKRTEPSRAAWVKHTEIFGNQPHSYWGSYGKKSMGRVKARKQGADGSDGAWQSEKNQNPGAPFLAGLRGRGHKAQVRLRRWHQVAKTAGKLKPQCSVIKL